MDYSGGLVVWCPAKAELWTPKILRGGGLIVKVKGLETKTELADRHPANVDKERGGKSSC